MACLHFAAIWLALVKHKMEPDAHAPGMPAGIAAGLTVLNIGIILASHINKAEVYGFAFYHIPSTSMQPALMPGDVILIDTWLPAKQPLESGDIVVGKRSEESMILAKRVDKVREGDDGIELFLQGDNSSRSIDSRRFGWVEQQYIIGKARFIWFSFQTHSRYFKKLNNHPAG